MIYYIIKVLLSSVVIVAISEISKRSTTMGSILASIPLVSLLAFVWMYIDTKDTVKIADLSQGIFWLVIPSLIFFILFPVLLKKNMEFWLSLGISLTVMIIGYFVMLFVLKKVGINIQKALFNHSCAFKNNQLIKKPSITIIFKLTHFQIFKL